MKRKVLSIFIALVLALSLCLVTAVPVGAQTNLLVPDPYSTIQAAIDAAVPGDTIIVAAGIYDPFTVETKTNLTIQSNGVVIVEGGQTVTIASGERGCVVFVKDSTDIILDGLDIQGFNLGNLGYQGKDYGVIYDNSSGEIKNCTVSPNTIDDMNSVAIGIWNSSDVTVNACTLENFGRLGMLIYEACTASVLDSTIIGQVYSGEDEVSYGIEVEAPSADPASACQVTIRGNEIYNCDNTFSPLPSWESAAILINGWLEHDDYATGVLEADCTVIMENNDIHDNYIGIYAVRTPSSYAHTNNIYDNRVYGVISADASDASNVIFDATDNWWGHASGPYHLTDNPTGTGDAVSDNVSFAPWQTAIVGGATVAMTTELPQIIAISVTPTSIDFGTLYPGDTAPSTTFNITNIGTVSCDVDALLEPSTGTVFDNLELGGELVGAWDGISVTVGATDSSVATELVVPTEYEARGTETATLIFVAMPK